VDREGRATVLEVRGLGSLDLYPEELPIAHTKA
jgi:hypothetical protein